MFDKHARSVTTMHVHPQNALLVPENSDIGRSAPFCGASKCTATADSIIAHVSCSHAQWVNWRTKREDSRQPLIICDRHHSIWCPNFAVGSKHAPPKQTSYCRTVTCTLGANGMRSSGQSSCAFKRNDALRPLLASRKLPMQILGVDAQA